MFEKKQSQSAGAGAFAIQAQGSVQVGITYEAARQIALDVYQANFPLLVAEAAQLARARAEELTDKFLKQLHSENPAGLAQAVRPDFQNALLNAQREHACAGSDQLADLLVDLLVDRTRLENRSLMQLVIDEALKTAPKLTEHQLGVLGAAFILGHARSTSISCPGVVAWLRENVQPVLAQATVTQSTLAHLQFTGCATANQFAGGDIAVGLLDTYSAFFQKGFTQDQLTEQALSESAMKFVAPMETQPDLWRVTIVNPQIVDELRANGAFDAEAAQKLTSLLTTHRKTVEEFRQSILEELPFMQRAFELWQKDKIGQLTLTSVGLAIGHAFVQKTLKSKFASLSIWIK